MTNKERYAELCSNLNIYIKPWWLDAVCGAENWDVLFSEKNGEICAALPYYIKKRLGLKYITVPPLTQHCGIWICYPEGCKYQTRLALEKTVLNDLIAQIETLPIHFYIQAHSPDLTNWLPYYWHGYRQTTHYTYRIAKTAAGDYESVFEQFNKVVRKNIEKARPLADIEESDDIALFHSFQSKTFARQGLSNPFSLEFLQKFDHVLAEHGCRKIFVARDADGNVHCASYIVFDEHWVYQLMSGTDPAFKRSEFKTLLIERALQFACETHRGFDFEGSMLEGVEEFFRKFGATQVPYFKIKKVFLKNYLFRKLIEMKLF